MAYSIKIFGQEKALESSATKVSDALVRVLRSLGMSAQDIRHEVRTSGSATKAADGSRPEGTKAVLIVELRRIRLDERREYCGNHPGPCDAFNPHRRLLKGGGKPKTKYMEAADWIRLHHAVNDYLDTRPHYSEVFSKPFECKGVFWIRRCDRRRMRFDYTERYRTFGVPVRAWVEGGTASSADRLQFLGAPKHTDHELLSYPYDEPRSHFEAELTDAAERLSTASSLLREVYDFMAPSTWTQGALYRSRSGLALVPYGDHPYPHRGFRFEQPGVPGGKGKPTLPVKFSLQGALDYVGWQHPAGTFSEASNALIWVLRKRGFKAGFSTWNDMPEREFRDVTTLISDAIDALYDGLANEAALWGRCHAGTHPSPSWWRRPSSCNALGAGRT